MAALGSGRAEPGRRRIDLAGQRRTVAQPAAQRVGEAGGRGTTGFDRAGVPATLRNRGHFRDLGSALTAQLRAAE